MSADDRAQISASSPTSGAYATIWLASRSPRRRLLLQDAGHDVRVMPPDIDDGRLRHGEVPPEWWVMALAYLKARRVHDLLCDGSRHEGREALALAPSHHGVVLGADTVCAIGREILGQPRDTDDARRMLRLIRGREHRTLTGVCLLRLGDARPSLLTLDGPWRLIVFDAAVVRVGEISDQAIDVYVRSGEWRGKAGAYNLSERIEAGWPIACMGDPATVMGLPMQRLGAWLTKAV
jgi:septum formation protein